MKRFITALLLLGSTNLFASTIEHVEQALTEGNVEGAKKEFAALPSDSKLTLRGKVVQGRFLIAEQQGEQAYDYFESLRKSHTESPIVNYYFAVSAIVMAQQASVFSKLGYAEDFVDAIEKTLTLNPEYIDALDTAIAFYLHAPSIAGGDIDKASLYANRLIELSPVKGYQQLARVYLIKEERENVYKTLAEGLLKHPKSSELYYSRAITRIEDERWQEARADIKLAVAYANSDDEKIHALYQQGKLAAETGQDVEAGISALTEIAKIDEQQYSNWRNYRLAQLYIHSKNYLAAKQQLDAIDFEDEDKLEKKVNKLKKQLKKLMS